MLFCRKEIALFPFTVNKPAWDWSLVTEVVPNVLLYELLNLSDYSLKLTPQQ